MNAPTISVVIPIYNEAAGLAALFGRLYPALDALGERCELILVDDGSRDQSARLLAEQFRRRPDVTRVILLATNFGQHMAIRAGFDRARGELVVTLDADLQNPPEEIAKLVAKWREGYDYVGSYRKDRNDTWFRRAASRLNNRIRERITDIRMTDQGCMLRAYGRNVVDAIVQSPEASTFIPALAYLYARNPVEIEVAHEARAAGTTKYSLFRLLELNFDLVTGFSVAPLRFFSMLGMLVALVSLALYIVVMALRLARGYPFLEVIWDRDILQFILIGMVLFGLGLVGEYVGRIHEQVRGRPRYLVHAVLESPGLSESWQPQRPSSSATGT
ncbi:MAG TPA: glycosyltransferase [Burkholderiales bacterium]|jgi:undecaprenyl-phosphate 4-deoxy-4-formamido-L-arabinose transferase|nr:glycosyltransferase [Burkholderiales bacterium]